jgi:hypothetical protein
MSTCTTTSAASTIARHEGFDFRVRVDELRCDPSDALRARVAEARREQQRWRLEEMAA